MANLEGAGAAREESPKPFCPKCGSTDIRASQTTHLLDSLLKPFSLEPQRCRACRKRFYLRKPVEPVVDNDEDAAAGQKNAD